MTDNITELLKEIEDIRIDGAYENLNDSLRTLVTQDQRLAAILDKAKISGNYSSSICCLLFIFQ